MELTALECELIWALIKHWFFFGWVLLILFIFLKFWVLSQPKEERKDPAMRGLFWVLVVCIAAVLICAIAQDLCIRSYYEYKNDTYECPKCGQLHYK